MRVAVPRETAEGERRVALVPETVSKLRDAGFEVRVERGAGTAAGFDDDDYTAAGAELADAASLTNAGDAVVCVASPSAELVGGLAEGTVVVLLTGWGADPDRLARAGEPIATLAARGGLAPRPPEPRTQEP